MPLTHRCGGAPVGTEVVLLVLATVALASARSTVRLAFEPAAPPPRA